MGTIQTIRPNGNHSGTAAFSLVGGGTTVWGNLSDASDTTKVQRTSSGDRTAWLDMGTYTVGAGTRVKRARAAARILFNAKPVYCSWAVVAQTDHMFGAGRYGVSRIRQAKNTAITTYYTDWANCAADTAQAEIDALQMFIEDNSSAALNYFVDVWTELDVIDQPTVTVTAGATSTMKPSIAFVYADGDGDAQLTYQVKIFNSATYSAGGFSADTSTPSWDSGELTGDAASVTCAVSLVNGTTYKAYVRVSHDGGDTPYYSAWTASSSWTISVTTCTTPTVTGIFSEADGRVELSIAGAAPPGGVTQTLRVERSDDAGVTWTAVRNYASATFLTPYTPTVYDYEAPPNIDVQYRVRAVGINGTGSDVSSAWSTVDVVTTWSDGLWWLKVPVDPSMNVSDVWVLVDPEIDYDDTSGVFRPIGSSAAVVVAGDVYGRDGSWQIRSGNTDDYQTIDPVNAALLTNDVLLSQDPFGTHKYVRITSRSKLLQGTADTPRELWTVSYVEVAMPATE